MLDALPTAFLFILAALILPLLPRGPARGALLLAVPALAAVQVFTLPFGNLVPAEFFGFPLELMRVDKLARVFALIFCIAAFLGNLYAWRATRPKDLFAATDPVGPANDRWLRSLARRADRIIVAWGAHAPVARSEAVSRLLARYDKPLLALGSTAAGQPRHPLYLRSDSPLFEWVVPKPRKVLRTKAWTLPSH